MKPLRSVGILHVLAWTISTAGVDSAAFSGDSPAAALSKVDVEFFEKNVRPVLADNCYSCHSAQAQKVKGKLFLDSRQGIAKGGESGAVITGRDPDQSR